MKDESEKNVYPLRGTYYGYLCDPFEPAVPAEDWEGDLRNISMTIEEIERVQQIPKPQYIHVPIYSERCTNSDE